MSVLTTFRMLRACHTQVNNRAQRTLHAGAESAFDRASVDIWQAMNALWPLLSAEQRRHELWPRNLHGPVPEAFCACEGPSEAWPEICPNSGRTFHLLRGRHEEAVAGDQGR